MLSQRPTPVLRESYRTVTLRCPYWRDEDTRQNNSQYHFGEDEEVRIRHQGKLARRVAFNGISSQRTLVRSTADALCRPDPCMCLSSFPEAWVHCHLLLHPANAECIQTVLGNAVSPTLPPHRKTPITSSAVARRPSQNAQEKQLGCPGCVGYSTFFANNTP